MSDESPIKTGSKPRLPDELDLEQLNKYFVLLPEDLAEIQECRGATNKIGFAIQLCSLRWFGFLLVDLRPTPQNVLDILTKQLGINEPIDLSAYPQSKNTLNAHPERIREYLGFQKCDELQRLRLLTHLTDRVLELPRGANLIDVACNWLYENQIVRPATRTLEDIITEANANGMDSVYKLISRELTIEQKQMIDGLLETNHDDAGGHSQLEELRKSAKRESTKSMNELTERVKSLKELPCEITALKNVPLPTRQLLSNWGYQKDVWSLRRFEDDKKYSIVAAFLNTALTDTVDAIVDTQDRLITRYQNQAKEKKDVLLRSAEKARTEAIEAFEDIGIVIVDEKNIIDSDVRKEVFKKRSVESLRDLLADCRSIKFGADAHLEFMSSSYSQSRKYSPQMLACTPFKFKENSPVGAAVNYMNIINQEGRRKLDDNAPTAFLSKSWQKHVMKKDQDGKTVISRPHYEMALMATINANIKAGEVTVSNSRRWGDLEDLLIPLEEWQTTRLAHYKKLDLPVDSVELVQRLRNELETFTDTVNKGVPSNGLLKIDAQKGTYKLSPFKGGDKKRARHIKQLRTLIQSELPQVDLVDILIKLDKDTGFLRHIVSPAQRDSKLKVEALRSNAIASFIAIGCNIGPYRMAMATKGITHFDISSIADWYFAPESLKAAAVDIVNYGFELPITKNFGTGEICSADGMRFYSPSNLLRTDFSAVLRDRGITMITHTADNLLMLHQQPVPCRLREAAYDLDGLLAHGTEMEPTTCFTDTHGYTETVMASGAMLGYQMAPRIKDIKDKTLYRFERSPSYNHLDPIIKGTIKTHLIHAVWDDIVRVIASIDTRRVSASLILSKLSSYARQNSLYQGLREIGRVHKTLLILRCLHDEDFRRLQTKEINKGERSHNLDRFLFFGKQGALRSKDFLDQQHSFSCLSILHNAIVAWNLSELPSVLERLKARGRIITDEELALVSPLLWMHVNPFGRYDISPERLVK